MSVRRPIMGSGVPDVDMETLVKTMTLLRQIKESLDMDEETYDRITEIGMRLNKIWGEAMCGVRGKDD